MTTARSVEGKIQRVLCQKEGGDSKISGGDTSPPSRSVDWISSETFSEGRQSKTSLRFPLATLKEIA